MRGKGGRRRIREGKERKERFSLTFNGVLEAVEELLAAAAAINFD